MCVFCFVSTKGAAAQAVWYGAAAWRSYVFARYFLRAVLLVRLGVRGAEARRGETWLGGAGYACRMARDGGGRFRVVFTPERSVFGASRVTDGKEPQCSGRVLKTSQASLSLEDRVSSRALRACSRRFSLTLQHIHTPEPRRSCAIFHLPKSG